MKWKNKGHELDKKKVDIVEKFGNNPKFYIFGAGKIGKSVSLLLSRYGCFAGFIDNNASVQNGQSAISLDNYLALDNRFPIIVSTNDAFKKQIKEQLENSGKKENLDFYYYDEFLSRLFPILSLALWKRTFVRVAQISLTERCSLKCIKCAHACSQVKADKEDLSIDIVKKSVDSFFKVVDVINELVLIGGEPFLYAKLYDAIEYISNKYRDRIVRLSITTNGTIIPSKELLRIIKNREVYIHISNYSVAIPGLKKQYIKLTKELDSYGIEYTLGHSEQTWMDYGFGDVDRKAGPESLELVFDRCCTPCREIRGEKYYHCVMARAVSENMNLNVGEDDYLDLDLLRGEKGRSIFEEFELGYSDKGYMEMCNYCRGAEASNYPIPVAEQEKLDLNGN